MNKQILAEKLSIFLPISIPQAASLSTLFDYGGILGGIAAGLITDRTGMSAATCSVMLIVAIPLLFLYNSLVSTICPISIYFPTLDDDTLALSGWPVRDACYVWNCLLLFLVGVLVNGPYALITTAVSAGLGQHPCLKAGRDLTFTLYPQISFFKQVVKISLLRETHSPP